MVDVVLSFMMIYGDLVICLWGFDVSSNGTNG
jgi:hypothetical protein